jgi:hypothetical protein
MKLYDFGPAPNRSPAPTARVTSAPGTTATSKLRAVVAGIGSGTDAT